MNITWPNTLPLPSVEGYGLTPQEAVLRTDMESGPGAPASPLSANADAHHRALAVHRVRSLPCSRPGTSTTPTRAASGSRSPCSVVSGLLPHEARFTRQFEAQLRSARRWDVKGELEIRERPTLDEGALNLLLELSADDLFAMGSELHQLVHGTLPLRLA